MQAESAIKKTQNPEAQKRREYPTVSRITRLQNECSHGHNTPIWKINSILTKNYITSLLLSPNFLLTPNELKNELKNAQICYAKNHNNINIIHLYIILITVLHTYQFTRLVLDNEGVKFIETNSNKIQSINQQTNVPILEY